MNDVAHTYIDKNGIPRCGCPDFNLSAGAKKWAHNSLSYFIKRRDDDLDADVWDEIIAKAFMSWSNVAALSFTKVDMGQDANIIIGIGAGKDYHFDGPQGTLAWAYLPHDDSFNGTLLMRFDTDETWVAEPRDNGTLLLNVASHEIGHILGLSHSSVSTALMAPYYSEQTSGPQENDDIPRIQELYGKA